MRVIFFGTPQLAVPSLEAVDEVADVALVVCQPDRRAGRGLRVRPAPVKARALALGLEVAQPRRVKRPAFAASLALLEADVAVVVAYGRILPRAVLDAPRRGCVNVHASILPRWRGAGPIQWAIIGGDERTGVCLMQMDEGMDTGPLLACEETPIDPDETAAELGERLAGMAATILRRELPRWVSGQIVPKPQGDEGVSRAPMLKKEDGRVDWSAPARAVHDRVRGMSPWPGAFTTLEGGAVLKLHRTRVAEGVGAPGAVLRADAAGIVVACGEGAIRLLRLQLAGKRRLDAEAFLAGRPLEVGTLLGGS